MRQLHVYSCHCHNRPDITQIKKHVRTRSVTAAWCWERMVIITWVCHAKSSHVIVHHCLPGRSTWVILWRLCSAGLCRATRRPSSSQCIMDGCRICPGVSYAPLEPVIHGEVRGGGNGGGVKSAAAAVATYRVAQNSTILKSCKFIVNKMQLSLSCMRTLWSCSQRHFYDFVAIYLLLITGIN